MTKREEAIYILGMLGYGIEDLKNALNLLENNTFKNLVYFISDLEIYNAENQSSAKVSLAGIFPSLKIKDGDWDEIEKLMHKCNVSI